MISVNDVRSEEVRRESNAHSSILEEIVARQQNHPNLQRVKSAIGHGYYVLRGAGVGYLAGYLASNGDLETATQFAEYATVAMVGVKLGLELPLKTVFNKVSKVSAEKIKQEAERAELCEMTGRLHKYKPEQGVEFTHHKANYSNLIANLVRKSYQENLETAKKPIVRTLSNIAMGATAFWLASLLVDVEVNVLDWFGPNLIEKGLDLTHYLIGTIEPIKDYVSLNAHGHVGDFNQMQMAYIGAVGGLVASAKEFAVGNYRRLQAKFRKDI